MDIKASLKKEMLDGVRNYRFLILFAGMLFFAILNPVMNKVFLPELLQSQFPGMTHEVMQEMLITTQLGNLRGYMGDVFQISTLIIAFTLSGMTASELSEKTLILPLTTGKRYTELLLAKLIVFGSFLLASATVSLLVNYLYSGVLFGFQLPSVVPVLRAGMLQGLYMLYVLGLLMLVGTLVKKPVATGLLVLIPAYGTRIIGDLLDIHRYLPSGLLIEAEMLAVLPAASLIGTILITLAAIVLMIGGTIIRLSNMELTRG